MYWYHEEEEAKSPITVGFQLSIHMRGMIVIYSDSWYLHTNLLSMFMQCWYSLINASMIFTLSCYRKNLPTNIMWVNLVFYYCHLWSCKDVFLLVLIQQPGAELFTLPKYMFLSLHSPLHVSFLLWRGRYRRRAQFFFALTTTNIRILPSYNTADVTYWQLLLRGLQITVTNCQ